MRILILALIVSLLPAAAAANPADDLHELVDRYFEESMEMNPVFATFNGDHRYNDRMSNSIGPEYLARSEAMDREYLEAIEAINPDDLEGQDLLSWEIFRRERKHSIEGTRFPSHLFPINQLFCMPIFFVQLGMPGGVTPFATVEDFDNWLSRIDGFEVWMDQAIANMREGMETGVVLPRVIVDKTLPVLASQVVEDPTESAFHTILTSLPEDFSEADRERITTELTEAISTQIVPSYRRVHDFMRDEYMPQARETTALTDLPDGEAWYSYAILTHTNSTRSPQEIHDLGLREVARINAERAELAASMGFEGSLEGIPDWLNDQEELRYSSEEDVLERYRALRAVVEPHLSELFTRLPKADFEIRKVEAYRQASTPGAHYMAPSADGTRPGIFYVNTGGWETRSSAMSEALFIHEAVPGHHFQVALARELDELPKFRRYGGYTSYSEGWGLYAERLGPMVGLYTDPFQRIGQLNSELFRAKRLVTDTGLHALGWSREEGLAYLGSETEIDRYIVMPGQALAYKMGELKILELRARAKEQLGDKFDLRAFHDEILVDGGLPLDVLDVKVTAWINAQAE